MKLSTSLAIALAALAIGACGDDSDDAETQTITVQTSASTTTAPVDPADGEGTGEVPADDSAGNPEQADDPGADRPRSVEDVINAVLTGSEKAAVICDQLVTPAYVEAAYGDRSGCVAAQQPGSLAKTVSISDVSESGAEATAVAVPSGGPYDGVDVQVDLVAATDLDGAWLIDSLVADVPAGP